MQRTDIIGGGLSGLYAACYLAGKSVQVRLFEKNDTLGGRSRSFTESGFQFDMGPTWYWMPDLVDKLFDDLGEKRTDYFGLTHLNPSYRVFWKDRPFTDVPADQKNLELLFDQLESKGSEKLKQFLADAKVKYEIATAEFMENPGLSLLELLNWRALKNAIKLDVFKSVDKDVSARFDSPQARAILNFPVLFLGEMPSGIPALYTLMNYVDLELGTWYPDGGMNALASALEKIARKRGVEIHAGEPVREFHMNGNQIKALVTDKAVFETDHVIASADYHFVEQNLVPAPYRRYSEKYWNSRKLAPSCLIFYVGVNKKIEGLKHHNLFFDEELEQHGKQIYDNPAWPDKPLFYVCASSKTDPNTAPPGHENLFFLMPVAPGIEDTPEIRERYFDLLWGRMEKHLGMELKTHIVYRRSFAIQDFQLDYNAFRGNAYGLANTLKQTANLKPKIKSKIKNLHYCGQLTVPGPGIPPALISGKIAAKQVVKTYEKTV